MNPSRVTRNAFMPCALVLLASLVTACASSASSNETTTSQVTTTTTDRSSTTVAGPAPAPSVDVGNLPDWFQNEDAAPQGLIDVIASEIDSEYVGSMQVDWPTGALGCDSGGYVLQVVTPGFVLFFDDGESLRRIHASTNGRWIECDLTRPLEGIPVVTS